MRSDRPTVHGNGSQFWNAVEISTYYSGCCDSLEMAGSQQTLDGNQESLIDLRNCKTEADDVRFVINILKCQNPQCDKYLTPPIAQCEKGHSICPVCSWGTQCPLCKANLISTQSIALENLVNGILLPCKNVDVGCVDKFPPAIKEVHEAECVYSFFKCICPECTWSGERDSLWEHMINNHREHTSLEPNMKFTVNLGDLSKCNYHKVILFHGTVFIARLFYQVSDNKLYGAVQILDERDVAEYRYEFTMASMRLKGERKLTFIQDVHTMAYHLNHIFQEKDCFICPIDQAVDFKSSDDLIDIALQINRYF